MIFFCTSHISRYFFLKFCIHTHHILVYLNNFQNALLVVRTEPMSTPTPARGTWLFAWSVRASPVTKNPKFHSTNNKRMNRPVPARRVGALNRVPCQFNSIHLWPDMQRRVSFPSRGFSFFFFANCPEVDWVGALTSERPHTQRPCCHMQRYRRVTLPRVHAQIFLAISLENILAFFCGLYPRFIDQDE